MLAALLIVARSVEIGASLLFAGIFTFEVVVLGSTGPDADDDRSDLDRRLLRLAFCALVAALLSAFLWFWLVVASMSELPLLHAFSGGGWRVVLHQTDFGRVWQVRLGLIVLAFVLVTLGLVQKRPSNTVKLVLWPLALSFLVSLAWVSHAAAASRQPLGLLGDALHLCAAGGWMGGLLPLVIFLARAKVSVSLRERAADVLRRFSALSLGCVSVLVLSGLSNSWLLVGSIGRLFMTPYGASSSLKTDSLRCPPWLGRSEPTYDQGGMAVRSGSLGFVFSAPSQRHLRNWPWPCGHRGCGMVRHHSAGAFRKRRRKQVSRNAVTILL